MEGDGKVYHLRPILLQDNKRVMERSNFDLMRDMRSVREIEEFLLSQNPTGIEEMVFEDIESEIDMFCDDGTFCVNLGGFRVCFFIGQDIRRSEQIERLRSLIDWLGLMMSQSAFNELLRCL